MKDEPIKEVKFIKSSPDWQSCPETTLPEYAFVGRSNVGKSSLINFLTNRKNLAKTSGKPGKTQLINHFQINEAWYLVDLPGYGYARISKKTRSAFLPLIYDYLQRRVNLACLFLLIDCRHEPQMNDLDFIRWMGKHQVPFVLCFTKTDKLGPSALTQSIQRYKEVLAREWETLPGIFSSSVTARQGREDILEFIAATNQVFAEGTHEK